MSVSSNQRFFLILASLIVAVSISVYMDNSLLLSPSSYSNALRCDNKISAVNRMYDGHHNTSHHQPSNFSERFIVNHQLDYSTCIENNNKAPDNWCLDTQVGRPHYVANEEWPPRRVQYYSLDGYEQCLANKTLVMIGDSKVRYQWMNLVSYLQHGRFMNCGDDKPPKRIKVKVKRKKRWKFKRSGEVDKQCVLINQRNSNMKWSSWYKVTDDMLQDLPRQSAFCDCYRAEKQNFRPETTYENRYVRRQSEFGDISLNYLMTFTNSIRIDRQFPPYANLLENNPSRCTPGKCGDDNRNNGFDGNLTQAIWEVLPKMNATHAFVSPGWPKLYGQDLLSRICCTITEFERQYPDIRVWLISDPPDHKANSQPEKSFDPRNLRCDCNILDRTRMTKGIPKHWYIDDEKHVLSIMNQAFNHAMMKKICPMS